MYLSLLKISNFRCFDDSEHIISFKDVYKRQLIGCSETRKRIDYQQVSLVFAYQGIVGENDEEGQIPFQQYLALSLIHIYCDLMSAPV